MHWGRMNMSDEVSQRVMMQIWEDSTLGEKLSFVLVFLIPLLIVLYCLFSRNRRAFGHVCKICLGGIGIMLMLCGLNIPLPMHRVGGGFLTESQRIELIMSFHLLLALGICGCVTLVKELWRRWRRPSDKT